MFFLEILDGMHITDDQRTVTVLQQFGQDFVIQIKVAEALAIMGKLKRHLGYIHPPKIRAMVFGDQAAAIKWQALGKAAPADDILAGLEILPQCQADLVERLVGLDIKIE